MQGEFFKDRRAALNSSLGCQTNSFVNVLKKHAVVLVDSALPNQNKSYYIRQGKRLGSVQQHWINVVQSVLPSTNVDSMYGQLVADAICESTDALMDSLVDRTDCQWNVIGEPLVKIHRYLSTSADCNAEQTRSHLRDYICELGKMYDCKSSEAYYAAGRRVFAAANVLGNWLDKVVFSHPSKKWVL